MAELVMMVLMLISEFGEFLLRVGLCSDIILGFDWFYCIDFKSGTRNVTEIHNIGETEDLGVPAVAPKSWFDAFRSSDFGSKFRMGLSWLKF